LPQVCIDSPDVNVVSRDTNACEDVFQRDLVTSVTTRVSLTLHGSQANLERGAPRISRDGRFTCS